MYGSTAVHLNSTVSLSGAGFLVLVTFCKGQRVTVGGENCRHMFLLLGCS